MSPPNAVSCSRAVALLGLLAIAKAQVPCFDTNLGADLNLGDDSVAVNLPLGFTFVRPGGVNTTAISVSANGFVWFGSNANSGCCNGDPAAFVTDPARLAVVWADLVPGPGAVHFNTLPPSGPALGRAVVTWNNVTEFGGTAPFTAQLQLFSDGAISMAWSQGLQLLHHAPLVGVTQGVNAVTNALDLSAITGAASVDTGTNPTVFEHFTAPFDLGGRSLLWTRNGTGGYVVREPANCRFASFTPYGRGCPSPPTVYELFAPGALDLANRSFRFDPNGAGGYAVSSVAQAPDLTVTQAVVLTRDDQVANRPLPFAWPYAGSVTTAIDISSNGCVYLVPGSIPDARCCHGNVARFLGEPPSIAVLWMDLLPPGGGAVFFDAPAGSNRAYVTWRDCPEYGNSALANTAQLVLESNGAFELRYGTVGNQLHDCLCGFTLGRGAPDPGAIDLSGALPFDTGPGGTPAQLAAAPGSRPAAGAAFALRLGGVPAGSQFGFLLLAVARQQPALDLGGQGMPGCLQHVDLGAISLNLIDVSSLPVQTIVNIPAGPGLLGQSFFVQAAVHAPGGNALQLIASNGGELAIGL